MFVVALFDRNKEHLKQIRKYIDDFFFSDFDVKVYGYDDEDEFLDFFDANNERIDLICLDAEAATNIGFYAAEEIRKVNVKVDIIFISSDLNGLPLGYKYHAFDYLVKPVRVADFRQTLNRLFYYSQSADSFFTIKINGNLERFRQNNILYFSSTARKVTMYTTDGQSIDFYAKLDEVMTRLGQNNFTSFFRTHQSYLVNRQHALRIENKNVVLDNDDMLPISKKYYDEVKSIF